ncbi:TetR family transcriptional regulator [Nocardioides albertanoniae]|uniref:TetR family transcriptional regulator n=1 Tax=Nocardioides albertanoniae TaxID=1175486 RepID=A0A543A2E1_9ACTN|nr:TetR/AcrR family transcriptional regulator [Nocardioides albertanoniae]TQL66747.1 TetR family transcriptional regulator [Nocardioides albertanoniae]
MARWEPDARGRMLTAALELFSEQGYEKTTACDIATRAGVTERTFFRHFADKREVLFVGGKPLDETVSEAIAAADESATPLQMVLAGVREAAVGIDAVRSREQAAERARIISSTPALRERELLKAATMTVAAQAALADRGVGEPVAGLAAHSAAAVFQAAFSRWISGAADLSLAECVDEAAVTLRDLR